MIDLRLQYKFETGEYPVKLDSSSIFGPARGDFENEYIDWLEERLLDDEALFILMNKILHEKNKRTEPPIPSADK